MALRKPWRSAEAESASSITRFIKGSRVTRFYGLWLYHKGSYWALWLGCPKLKIVRLVLLLKHGHDASTHGNRLAPVIPITAKSASHLKGLGHYPHT
ncbi:hypothetical protein [Aeromonas cavernicola]|uniref:Uncharacterized protein n=1 Tax=Aeromonas cavernicola TaxID=1006623 RepID=A0A2H9U3L7_9GAMM|nr:hypothetical protein [Aeromonas cavernicola]PJG58569.1 hypothetical protein CUC53_11875 [Aeromonas cavernicola]